MSEKFRPNHLRVVHNAEPRLERQEASPDELELREKHEAALRVMIENLSEMPPMMQAVECLCLASSLIDEAAYKLAEVRPDRESAQLFLIAASLATEVERVAGTR